MSRKQITNMDFMSIKNNLLEIKKSMKRLRITESDIAQHVMRSQNKIKQWLTGKVNLPHKDVLDVCDFLSVDPFDIMQEKTIKNRSK